MPLSRSITEELPTGKLQLSILKSDYDFHGLLELAARQNPKRGFLFVSKVLGRHIPVEPNKMRQINQALAAQIAPDLPGPVVFIGMCETAICLGQSVFEEFVNSTGRQDVLFLHSTRYHLDADLAFGFEEAHCHASSHRLYLPNCSNLKQLFNSARSLVLVDDETSSGNTLVNLTRCFKQNYPSVERVVTAVITDWRPPSQRSLNARMMPVVHQSISLLDGEYHFTPCDTLHLEQMPRCVGNGELKDAIIPRNYGRLGYQLDNFDVEKVAEKISVRSGERILVLGTGEFSYPPYLLAQILERRGARAYCQSTTRSPVKEGLAIKSKLVFSDNYGDGIVNFLYNHRRLPYDRVLLCHETPACYVDHSLICELNAELIQF